MGETDFFEEENLILTDLIDVEILQQMQDVFVKMTGIPAVIVDNQGYPVTEGVYYKGFLKCHRGLRNLEGSIMVGEYPIGTVIAGPVLTQPYDVEQGRKDAAEKGLDVEEFLLAVGKVPVVGQEDVDRENEFLLKITKVLSSIGYSQYRTMQANAEIEHAAHMKSDFLANMSHEIRTPMNAVIGMAEMALREELTPVARNHINQIKSSGNALLAIINDILDFSKIESGKLDINEVEYEPMSIINDVSNIIMTRIGSKKLELELDVPPDLPRKLYGDNLRIQQVIINLANNAVKFTPKGRVLLEMSYEKTSDEWIDLKFSVKDTGIGIKEEDYVKLFKAFQQLDSKRNRHIEGTGLGLAISKQLVSLMNGEIWIDKEYVGGSSFSFKIPQRIVEWEPSIEVRSQEKIVVAGLIKNEYVKAQMIADVKKLGAEYVDVAIDEEVEQILGRKATFLFVEESQFSAYMEYFAKNNPQITCVLLTEFNSEKEYNLDNLLLVKKPLYALNMAMILNHEDVQMVSREIWNDEFVFTAPEAEVLIVDDNLINLTVAEGLLKPLQMKIDTALSGKIAIGKVAVKKYDLIFMDHMMPGIDGVEATHIIRRFHKEYADVPIIALTANAVSGVREMFLAEGMNDFVAKPIELKMLISKVKQWLPPEKIQRSYGNQTKIQMEQTKALEITNLDVASALQLLGTEELFWKVLGNYYNVIEKKAALIKRLEEAEVWQDYTVEVHALKSASKQIGAMELSAKAARLEEAGNVLRNAGSSEEEKCAEKEFVHGHTDELLEQYRSYLEILLPYFEKVSEDEGEKEVLSAEKLKVCLVRMKKAADDLDMDTMENLIEGMKKYRYAENGKEYFERLKTATEEMDVDACIEIAEEWEKAVF